MQASLHRQCTRAAGPCRRVGPSPLSFAAALRPAHKGRSSVQRSATPTSVPGESRPRAQAQFPYRGAEDKVTDDNCASGFVFVDNDSHPNFTVMQVEIQDYPGLLRIMSWVLNGMSVRVHHAVLDNQNGQVKDMLWLTDLSCKKLKTQSAELLADRLQDFLVYCAPQGDVDERKEWTCGPLSVSNAAHPQFTHLSIRGDANSGRPGFLLELTSALAAVGASIQYGTIQGSADVPALVAAMPCALGDAEYDYSKGRYFSFLLSDPKGNKLSVDRISSLVFTLGLIGGRGIMPTTAPNLESILKPAAGPKMCAN